MTPEERAAKVMVGWHTIIEEDFRQTIQSEVAAAIREAVKAERDGCELIALRYRDRMQRAVHDQQAAGRPTHVAECKFDAADSIATAIRSRP